VRSVAERYLAYVAKRLRTADQLRSTLERLIYPAFGNRPISEIKRSDVVKLMDRVEAERGARMADEVLGTLRRLFNWHAARHDTFNSPIVRNMARTTPESRRRDRVLSDNELARVWRAAGDAGMFGSFVRFLLASGARRNEAAKMTWSELRGSDWHLPSARNNTGGELGRPLSPLAMSILEAVPRREGCPYVFSANGRVPLSGFDKPKRALDKAAGITENWRLHDTRRVVRSLLSRARVPNEHAEAVLGHTFAGVRKTYDVWSYH